MAQECTRAGMEPRIAFYYLKLFVSKTPRSHLEVKETALAWHYREADAWLADTCATVGQFLDIYLLETEFANHAG